MTSAELAQPLKQSFFVNLSSLGDSPAVDRKCEVDFQNNEAIIQHAKDWIVSLVRLCVPLHAIPVQPQLPETAA